MGQKPWSKYIRCGKCTHEYADYTVRECPHPTVNKVYGKYICLYCCGLCKHKVKIPYIGSWGCGYREEDEE